MVKVKRKRNLHGMEWADLGWVEKAESGGVQSLLCTPPGWVRLEDGTVGGAKRHLTDTLCTADLGP